jgi:hypothetical protein
LRDVFNKYCTAVSDTSSLRVKTAEASTVPGPSTAGTVNAGGGASMCNYYDDANPNSLTRNSPVRLPDKHTKVFSAIVAASVQVCVGCANGWA